MYTLSGDWILVSLNVRCLLHDMYSQLLHVL